MFGFIGYVIIILIIAAGVSVYRYVINLKSVRRRISEGYGKPVDMDRSKTDIKYAASYFNNRKEKAEFVIDDITWNDLDMDKVFSEINNAYSSPGEEVLYGMLREPLFSQGELVLRDKVMDYFDKNEKQRFDVLYLLGKLGRRKTACLIDYFCGESDVKPGRLNLYRVLAVMPVVSALLCFLSPYALMLLLCSIIANVKIYFSTQKKAMNRLDDYMYIIAMVNCAKKLSELEIGVVNEMFPDIHSAIQRVKGIRNKGFNMISTGAMSDAMILSEYFKIVFLTDVIKFEKIGTIIRDEGKSLISVYEFVGMLDSLISAASYRRTLKYWVKPELSVSQSKSDNKVMFSELYHPLIKEPVENSCSITKPILLTGSNASGKSTFLKTVAISSITAQTIYTAFANKYDSSYFRLYTSMALKDNIFNNESYFVVEIKSLKRIMDSLDNKFPCLCFVDEILRGTNTVERIAASSEVLNSFADSSCICVAATHDVELTYILESKYRNYHFQERIENNSIEFDYKLYEGRTETRNAIKLLSFMGYSSEIVDRAEKRAENFLSTNIWDRIKAE